MSTLSNLLRQVARTDPQLAADLASEVKALSGRREFGLNFERHIPEVVELPGRPVRKGDKVRFLAPRGAESGGVDRRLWTVTRIIRSREDRIARLARRDEPESAVETTERSVDDLVVVAEFRDPVYPGLRSTGRVERHGGKPVHTVINAENFHALQLLLYTHAGKVDAIYIDPPYNTGARDWKYNNDYVDADDAYRHSKWLAFMERRLTLAKRLINPDNSVLIVTIDEKEYLRLGLLIQQVFPDAAIQMVTSVIAPAGQARGNQMYRVEEYIFVVYLGTAKALPGDDLLSRDRNGPEDGSAEPSPVIWENLLRRGTSARRADRERQFFPIFIDPDRRTVLRIGDPLVPSTVPRDSVSVPDGAVAVWPIRSDGSEGRWRVGREGAERLLERGLLRVGQLNSVRNQWAISYLLRSDVRRLDQGEIVIDSWHDRGYPILKRVVVDSPTGSVPKTVWYRDSHNAGNYGSALLREFIPGRAFPFPKSLYAVEDTLRIFVLDKPQAIVLDFFAGSGTTAHAVMRLNKQDGGRRQSVSVTNNEVSATELAGLRARGLRPGDAEWEALGICDYITKPRLRAAVTGQTPGGEPVKGDYTFVDEFPMSQGLEENVEFFTMTYEAPRTVAHNRAFTAIAPLLWIKAGSQGRRIETVTADFDLADTYGVLFDLDHSRDFLKAVQEAESVRVAFIVTDDEQSYQMVCAELPAGVEPVRLYESYLANFAINTGRE